MSSSFATARAIDISEQAADHFNNPETAGKLFVPNGLARANVVGFRYRSMEQAFPAIDPGLEPSTNLILVQVRLALSETAGGIQMTTENRRTEQDNTQIARIVGIGPMCFVLADGGRWPDAAIFQVGDYVRIPKYQGDRFLLRHVTDDQADDVEFVLFKDRAILGRYTSDPLAVRAFY